MTTASKYIVSAPGTVPDRTLTNRVVVVLHTARVRVWQMATIPMPEPVYMLETSVRIGARGPQFVVTSDMRGQDMRVYPTYAPRCRPMRRCPARSAIVEAVTRALPFTRPTEA